MAIIEPTAAKIVADGERYYMSVYHKSPLDTPDSREWEFTLYSRGEDGWYQKAIGQQNTMPFHDDIHALMENLLDTELNEVGFMEIDFDTYQDICHTNFPEKREKQVPVDLSAYRRSQIEIIAPDDMPKELVNQLVDQELDANRYVNKVEIIPVDEDRVKTKAYITNTPFERIRRITGYLVGTLDRFNDAKRSEVEDRVKHGTSRPITEMAAVAIDSLENGGNGNEHSKNSPER